MTQFITTTTSQVSMKVMLVFTIFNNELFLVTRMLIGGIFALQFTSDEKASEIEAFFSVHGNPSVERTVKQSIERVRINAQWVKHVRLEEGFCNVIQELLAKN
mgnify:FL=1